MTIKPRLFLLALLTYHAITLCYANAVTDGTMGANVTLTNSFTVPQSLGTTVGNNLFHSFTRFNIDAGKTATFTGSNNLQNVFTRVTGGDISRIDGTLKSNIAHANFYLINPNGVIFGKDARIDVPASFRVSTADELRFQGGGVFSASTPTSSTLTASEPEAYGFLNDRSSEIAFLGGGEVNDDDHVWEGKTLADLKLGSTFELVGGKINIQNTQVLIPSGEFRLIAQNHAGEVALNGEVNKTDGDITINKSWLDASGEGVVGYSILRGGDVTLNTSYWLTNNLGLKYATENSEVNLHATNLSLYNSLIDAKVKNEDAVNNKTDIAAPSNTSSSAKINIVVDNNMSLTRTSAIHTSAINNSLGNAGALHINVGNSLSIRMQSFIGSYTYSTGNGGEVVVNADNLTIDAKNENGETVNINKTTGITSSANFNPNDINSSTGNAGDITVHANTVNLRGANAGLISDTWAKGHAGKINVYAKEMSIDGEGLDLFTGISTANIGTAHGNAGKINVAIDGDLKLSGGGVIQSYTEGSGKAGIINIQANQLLIDGGTEQYKDIEYKSAIFAAAYDYSSGQVGDISVHANKGIQLTNGAEISISNYAIEHAVTTNGLISLNSPIINMDSKSIISSASFGNNAASNITIQTQRWFALQNSKLTTSVAGSKGNGGDIRINSPVIILNNAQIKANTNADNAQGGHITVNTEALIPSGNTLDAHVFGFNSITADAPNGINGIIHITSPQLNLSGVLANLQPANFEHQKLIHDVCNTSAENSLTKVGRGGLLPSAGDVLGF